MSAQLPARSAITQAHRWNTESIFATPEAWEAEYKRITETLPTLAQFRGHLGDSPAKLADWFETLEALAKRLGHVAVYAGMERDVDTGNQATSARDDQADALTGDFNAASAFMEPELLAIGFEKLRQWLQQEPRLAIYTHYFDILEKQQAHKRSAEVEELLGGIYAPFRAVQAIHGTLADADLVFPPAKGADGREAAIGQGTINALLADPDRELRRTAWEQYADAHLAVKNTIAACYSALVKQHVFTSKARRYSNTLEAALKPDFIPVEVFHQLIATYKKNIPTWHRYWRARRKLLGYDKLHVYDVRAPMTTQMPTVSWEQAVQWCIDGMHPLGKEYTDIMARGLREQRWVDIYPNHGKRAGAYSTGRQGTHPFIFMSFNDDIFGVSTLIHELGHSMHSYYANANQPYIYSDYSLFVAEVASNFNQALLRAHLLETQKDRHFQIALIDEAMANFHRYFFIMPTLARFELEAHTRVENGKALPADDLINLMCDLFAEGYGSEVDIDRNRIGSVWMQFSTHLYYNFYVYQYATGISGAHALAEGVLAGKPKAVENYLSFLKAGGSLYPLEALKLAGVDLTSPEPVEKTFGVLSGLVDRLEKLAE